MPINELVRIIRCDRILVRYLVESNGLQAVAGVGVLCPYGYHVAEVGNIRWWRRLAHAGHHRQTNRSGGGLDQCRELRLALFLPLGLRRKRIALLYLWPDIERHPIRSKARVLVLLEY